MLSTNHCVVGCSHYAVMVCEQAGDGKNPLPKVAKSTPQPSPSVSAHPAGLCGGPGAAPRARRHAAVHVCQGAAAGRGPGGAAVKAGASIGSEHSALDTYLSRTGPIAGTIAVLPAAFATFVFSFFSVPACALACPSVCLYVSPFRLPVACPFACLLSSRRLVVLGAPRGWLLGLFLLGQVFLWVRSLTATTSRGTGGCVSQKISASFANFELQDSSPPMWSCLSSCVGGEAIKPGVNQDVSACVVFLCSVGKI